MVQQALEVVWEEDVLAGMGRTTKEAFPRGDADVFRIAFDIPIWLVWGVAIKYQDAIEESFSKTSWDPIKFPYLVSANNYFAGGPGISEASAGVKRIPSFDEFFQLAELYLDSVNY